MTRFRIPQLKLLARAVLAKPLRDYARKFAIPIAIAVLLVVPVYYYFKYSRLIDRALNAGIFANTIDVYAAPVMLAVGDRISAGEIAQILRQGGYSQAVDDDRGHYRLRPDGVEIYPGRDSRFARQSALVQISEGRVSRIILSDSGEARQYRLEPRFITNVSGRNRQKRRLLRFTGIPPALIHAVVSAEDKRFFQHTGVDFFRMVKAAYVDMREGRKEQGASTLSMQLARSLWLDADKSLGRKAAEMLIASLLEEKLTKQQIFEYYCNEIYLGRRGTFDINGFGEGARVFFNKDAARLTIPEAALLAGLVQRPSYYNPLRYPERARERRNLVLNLMRSNGYINQQQYGDATRSPVGIEPGDTDSIDAQYSIDLVNDELQNRLLAADARGKSVYTTLDLNLQAAAEEAVRVAMPLVDQQLRGQLARSGPKTAIPTGQPQVALVAIDPHTGEIKALSGGRNYRQSQLDRALAARQPGSVFKPFVYAAALDSLIEGRHPVFTPASVVIDQPTTFRFDGETYEPDNFHHAFYGGVTLRSALAHSMNTATVKLAQMVGYGAVVDMARRAGLNERIQPTPAVALGAYETTPLEMAGAYTVFANQGVYVRPTLISMVRSRDGRVLYTSRPETRRALDERVAYLMVSLLEGVMRYGTAAGVRSQGFAVPAAGKTGTSRDGWFAGFTSRLLCVVWVGFDDNRELGLEGARSALPVWTEFMKRATQLREYRDAAPFSPPRGIVSEEICPESGLMATPGCPSAYSEVFIAGSQPLESCRIHQVPDEPPHVTISENNGERRP